MQPWSIEKRDRTNRKIEKEADRAAARLGAKHVVIIAFFEDSEYLHMQDGGKAPMPLEQLYKQMLSVRHVLDASGGEDVAMN